MLNMDKEAIKELLEMEAVPVCNILGSLLGRNVKMTVSGVEETDTDGLAECLPHFNVVIEGRRTANGLTADQLLVFSKEDMVRLTNYIMGVPIDTDSPLDEIALSTLKEVASQCMTAAVAELNDFLGRDMGEFITRISAYDNTERVQDLTRVWGMGSPLVIVRLHYTIDGVVDSDAYILASQTMRQVLGIPVMEEMPMPAIQEHMGKPKEAVSVQEVAFPEFKYTPLRYDREQIGDDKKKLLDITLDVSVRIGSTVCSVKDVLSFKEGQVLVLDKQAGSPADVVANGELIGRGDVLVSGDHFGARIIEIMGKRE
ncbi:flagellar motor switch protein FliN [Clostridiales bacterium TF09-2AC]|nr:flagellar motor switch protein FliN [Clostridiales bacterium TF09-2AC]